jgi:hypothetical protein
MRIDGVNTNHPLNHLLDRGGFAVATLRVTGLKPVEASIRIIGALLLRHQQRKPVTISKRRPPRTVIIARCRLPAAVQHHDECGTVGNVLWKMHPHLQIARVGSKARNFFQRRCRISLTWNIEMEIRRERFEIAKRRQ